MVKLLSALALSLVVFIFSSTKPINPTYHAPRIIKVKEGTSTNWSGYAVETNLNSPQPNSVTDVKGSWVVPALTCNTTNTYSSAWVGIDGYSNNTVEQTGTEQDCINGSASYYAWFEMYPKLSYRINLVVKANDVITAEVKYSGNGNFALTLNDQTSGKTFTTTQKSPKAQRTSAEWVMEAPYSGGVLPLANFGTIQFSGASATINGTTGSISNGAWQNDPITMVSSSGTKATPSALANNGSSFSVTWSGN